MVLSPLDRQLCRFLCELPKNFYNRYVEDAKTALLETLFRSLAGNKHEHLRLFFPNGPPISGQGQWKLCEAQGATAGAEYSAAARGKVCGHILKAGDMIYKCRTCSADDTCVLCSKCFAASDHTDHMVFVSMSPGNSGCCDCGDPEAWRTPVMCAIHTTIGPGPNGSTSSSPPSGSHLRPELVESIRVTVARALDYICDVVSCSPEQLRLPKSEKSIISDERSSRLRSRYYDPGDQDEEAPEYVMVLWNDEKHTIPEVQQQINRACRKPASYGLLKANEVDNIGRSIIEYDTDLPALLAKSKIMEQIKITITIRSARDTFREQMCGTIVEWLLDIAGCSVGDDHDILRQTICEEMLKAWRTGSEASNAIVGTGGLDDREIDDRFRWIQMGLDAPIGVRIMETVLDPDDGDDDDDNNNNNNNNETNNDEAGGQDTGGEAEMEIDQDLAREDADGDFDMGNL